MNLKVKTRIILAVLIVVIFSLIYFLIYPLFNDIKKISFGIFNQKQRLLLLESNAENLERFKNRYAEIEPDVKKTEALFIKADLPVDFIRFLEKTAKDSNVEAKISLSSVSRAEGKPWQILPFQMTIVGFFPNFLVFLEKLQSSQYLINAQDLSISKTKDAVSASISFQVLAK
ncbi:MAG: type 4a pilus biogenesis protein PilO [Candidatus Nealsonbacteria bacterium]|nr:type 4a pilus biogenesis protein PilO [Candidatus Nealsonbacteria bacterium]